MNSMEGFLDCSPSAGVPITPLFSDVGRRGFVMEARFMQHIKWTSPGPFSEELVVTA